MDESLSFGTLGATGRGVIEHFRRSPSEVDVLVGSLEHALGKKDVKDTQRAYVV